MKLRNKETGEIGVINLKVYGDETEYVYDRVETLYQEWEDITPKEPLIKDEKIRKAVRAWADANNIGVVKVNPYAVFDIESSACICFYGRVIEDKDDEKKSYIITELCGDKE